MGIEVVIGYLVVGTVETVTESSRKTFIMATAEYEYDNCSANYCY